MSRFACDGCLLDFTVSWGGWEVRNHKTYTNSEHVDSIFRVFFGCDHGADSRLSRGKFQQKPINVSSIRLIETAMNYQKLIKGITAFDNMISHNYDANISEGWKIGKILSATLINNRQNQDNKQSSYYWAKRPKLK